MTIRLGTVCIGKREFVCRAVPFSPNKRMHWARKAEWTKAWKEEVRYRLLEAGVRSDNANLATGKKANIAITLYTIRPQDYDNSVAAVKAIIDGMKGLVFVDDSPKYLNKPKVKTVKVAHLDEQRVEITF